MYTFLGLTECPVYMKAEDQFVKTKHTYFDVCPTFFGCLGSSYWLCCSVVDGTSTIHHIYNIFLWTFLEKQRHECIVHLDGLTLGQNNELIRLVHKEQISSQKL